MAGRVTKDPDYIKLLETPDAQKLAAVIKETFSAVNDPRQSSKTVYPFWFLTFCIVFAYLANANTLADIALLLEYRIDSINELVQERFPTPSCNTLWWALSRIHPALLQQILKQWVSHIPGGLENKLLIVDGKRLKGSSSKGKLAHLIELFTAENRLILGQKSVSHQSAEPNVLEALIDDIDISGSIVSTDALFARTSHMEKILQHKADYLIGLKANQHYMYEAAKDFFAQVHQANKEASYFTHYVTPIAKGHGRSEQRWIHVCNPLSWVTMQERWPGLKSVIEVKSERAIQGKRCCETRYYFSSHVAGAREFARLIRGHWGIENHLHWMLDVVFKEDASIAKAGFTAENMAFFRRLCMNIVKTTDPKRGLSMARKCYYYEPRYLRELLAKLFIKT
ncbi:MAG: ISAs1 family transposase [Candidatus Rhabdochlamydia sp.]